MELEELTKIIAQNMNEGSCIQLVSYRQCRGAAKAVLEALKNAPQNTAPNNNYTKCLDELWKHIELNAKNGSFAKSSIAEILKKHFA